MWILPLILLGAFVVGAAASSKSPREIVYTPRPLPPAPSFSPSPAVAGVPGPIAVLGEILKIGQMPPPQVILCAIAEAESLGRQDLASDIVRAFVTPVVQRHAAARPYERGTCKVSCSPRAQADQRGTCAPRMEPVAPQAPQPPPQPPQVPQAPQAQVTSRPATQDELLAMLNVDPQAFLDMMSSGRQPMVDVQAPSVQPSVQPSAEQSSAPAQTVVGFVPDEIEVQPAWTPGSPLGNVPDDAWRQFVSRLEREAPAFDSSRHVGQYRQRRERLAELGIDPRAILGSVAAQRSALDADLADAYGHAAAGGLFEHLGRAIAVPGHDGSATITLSGVLGVIQCAGLDGAVGWLEKPNDRKRYPHTTQAFLRCNGAF
jgi:hypothetical protein